MSCHLQLQIYLYLTPTRPTCALGYNFHNILLLHTHWLLFVARSEDLLTRRAFSGLVINSVMSPVLTSRKDSAKTFANWMILILPLPHLIQEDKVTLLVQVAFR